MMPSTGLTNGYDKIIINGEFRIQYINLNKKIYIMKSTIVFLTLWILIGINVRVQKATITE